MPDTVTRRNLSRGGASSGSEIPDSGFRIPNFASPPACRFRSGPAIPHARSGRILGPPAPPDCNRAAAVLHEKRAHDNGVRSAPSYARTAEPVRRDETRLFDGRSRSPPQGSGRCIPRRAGRAVTPRVLTLPASCGQAPFPNMLNRLRQHLTFGPQRPRHPQTEEAPFAFMETTRPRRTDAEQGQDRTRPRRTRPKRLFLPVPGSRERHFPYTSPRPAFSVFFISEMIVIGPTPPGTGVM